MSLIAALAGQGNSQDDSADSERRNPEPTSAPDQAFLRHKDRPITFHAGEQRGRVHHSPKQAYASSAPTTNIIRPTQYARLTRNVVKPSPISNPQMS